MRRTVVVMLVAIVALTVAAWPASAAPDPARAGQEARIDFNNDGFADLAVGAPGEGVGSRQGAGAVNVLYGTANGLEASTDLFFQGAGGVAGATEPGDGFGAAVTKGDFNADGFFDLAVGAPGEDVSGVEAAGAVNVLVGSAGGLTGGPVFVQSNPEQADSFGAALAAGDYNGDGFFDVAVGVPGESVGAVGGAGAVTVLFGSAASSPPAR